MYSVVLKMAPFTSITPAGDIVFGFPIGNHPKFQGFTLLNPNKSIISLPKIFIMFRDVTHETGMVSVRKQAGFTIVAKNKNVGITRQDIVDQVPRIVRLMMDNPDIFDMRPWSNYDWLFINGIHNVMPGYFVVAVMQNMNDPDKYDPNFKRSDGRQTFHQFILDWAAKKLQKDISEIDIEMAIDMYQMAREMSSELDIGEDD